MNLRDFEYLVSLDEHRHFGKAAAACYVSQPTLSTQLKKLEAELGVELIERSPRQVTLTTAGRRVVAKARTILAHAQEIRGIARQAQDPRSGSVRLGVFPTLAPYLLPHVVPPLHRGFPDLELLLSEAKTDDLLDQLSAAHLDAAILALPVADESLHVEPLFREDFLLAVPAGHPLAERRDDPGGAPLEVLADSPLLLLEEGHCLRDQALAVCRKAGGPVDGFTATSLETLRHVVAAGVGITLLPELAVSPPVAASEGIVLLRFQDPAPHRDIGLFWRRTTVYRHLLPEIADALRTIMSGLLELLPHADAVVTAADAGPAGGPPSAL